VSRDYSTWKYLRFLMKTHMLWHTYSKANISLISSLCFEIKHKGKKNAACIFLKKEPHLCSGAHFKTLYPTVLAVTTGQYFNWVEYVINLGFTCRTSSAYISWGIPCLNIRNSGEKKKGESRSAFSSRNTLHPQIYNKIWLLWTFFSELG